MHATGVRLEDPASLSRRRYADITAYVLSVNGFPGGAKELGNTLPA